MRHQIKTFPTFPILLIICLSIVSPACKSTADSPLKTPEQSNVEIDDQAPPDSINWSAVTPDILWECVGELYQSDGPKFALSLLEQGINNRIVTSLEADQTRAGFLYELGRLDEAFLALVQYRLDAERPHLLRLRAEILWQMARYQGAKRDYETLLEAQGDEPESETIFALARLYDDLGEWDKTSRMREQLLSRPDDLFALNLILYDAIQAEDVNEIRVARAAWSEFLGENTSGDVLLVLADIYIAYLDRNKSTAIETARNYLSEHGFNLSVAMILLRLDAECDDFSGFETDLRNSLDRLDAIRWLDAPGEVFPAPVARPLDVASLLDSASALELGRGNRTKARLLAERAKDLYPYDYVATLQLAAVEITEHNIDGAFQLLNEAVSLAPPSDVRTRLRTIYFASLKGDEIRGTDEHIALVEELDEILGHWESSYPGNAFYRSVRGELVGWRGDFEGALRIIGEASELPGATREMHFRRAYYLIKLGRIDEAWEIAAANLPARAPFLTLASSLEQEANSSSDESLATFAKMVRDHLDPENSHADYFAPTSAE